MDSERLGRVLGVGARHAAKTVVGAIDAASAPPPRPRTQSVPTTMPKTPGRPAAAPAPSRLLPSRPPQRAGVTEGARRFGRAVWEPAVRLSGVLWLEVTGLFFSIFALLAAIAAWHLRTAARLLPGNPAPNAAEHTRLLLAVAMLLVFGYFAASSFLRAHRRGRRR